MMIEMMMKFERRISVPEVASLSYSSWNRANAETQTFRSRVDRNRCQRNQSCEGICREQNTSCNRDNSTPNATLQSSSSSLPLPTPLSRPLGLRKRLASNHSARHLNSGVWLWTKFSIRPEVVMWSYASISKDQSPFWLLGLSSPLKLKESKCNDRNVLNSSEFLKSNSSDKKTGEKKKRK